MKDKWGTEVTDEIYVPNSDVETESGERVDSVYE